MTDPRPSAVSAPAGEATNGLPISDDDLLRRASAWLVTDAGDSPYTRDLIAMLSERLSQCQPAPASGAPDEDARKLAMMIRHALPHSTTRDEVVAAWDAIDKLESRLAASERAGEAMREIRRMFAVPLGRDVVADLRTFRETMREDAERERGAMREVCKWRLMDDDYDGWETDCGEAFVLNEGTPAENNIRFCCYCGKPLAALSPTSPAPSPETTNG